ncbi:hypothetical protein CL97_gp183 [Cronobacter phage CR9]|uniref:Uncharacterized protein n=1 Tax=Cronobacter phage CR9 TaxID=1162290 RepID=M1F1C5_9CAUD|nr:hypothetical protein CL97_gp183 [Cronobacter phage CR9]AFH21067.1 hypothetical protein CR9_183 [Cronobacter phage CR9]
MTEDFKQHIKERIEKLDDEHLRGCLGEYEKMLSKRVITDKKIQYAYEMLCEQAVKRGMR